MWVVYRSPSISNFWNNLFYRTHLNRLAYAIPIGVRHNMDDLTDYRHLSDKSVIFSFFGYAGHIISITVIRETT